MKLSSLKLAAVSAVIALAPLPSFSAENVTLYLDGALVTRRENARNGYLEFSLPASVAAGSLRISPANGVTLTRVITSPREPSRSVTKELASLVEQEELLHDRLKALSVREEIFKAAAKSQSAKAPRRTRTNPEPLAAIRKGTDYAITQLESVYQARRRIEKELARIAVRRSKLQKEDSDGGMVARVWLAPPSGRVMASWLQTDRYWTPSYQLRIDASAGAVFSLHAEPVPLMKGETATLHLSRFQNDSLSGFTYADGAAPLQTIPATISGLQGGDHRTPLSLTIVNGSAVALPPGDVACFKDGVYVGKGMFKGAEAGKSSAIICSERHD